MLHPVFPRVVVREKLAILLAHHRAARSAGRDDVVIRRILKDLDEALAQLFGLVVKAIVEKGLPAASLRLRKMNGAAEAFEDFRHRNADAGIELIGQAGDE